MSGSVWWRRSRDKQPSSAPSLRNATLWLASAGIVTTALGFVTGPVQARALHPAGRGLLAGAVVPVTLAGQLVIFGLGDFAARVVAQGQRPTSVFKRLAPSAFAIGCVGALILIILSSRIAHRHEVVRHLLLVGAATIPLAPLIGLLTGIAGGLQRWRVVTTSQVISVASNAVVIVTLAALGSLTVTAAALSTFGASLLSCVAFLGLRDHISEGLAGEPELVRGALSFGARATIGTVAILINVQLDQLLMLPLSTARQLGLYAVAVTMASAPLTLVSPVANALFPRVAAGEIDLVPRACRAALAATIMAELSVVALSYPVIVVLFGKSFSDAAFMAMILAAAMVPATGATVLGFAIRSRGFPGSVSIADGIATLVTVVGLIFLLPPLGGIGAGLVTVVAYSCAFGLLVITARRRLGLSARDCLRVSWVDVRAVTTSMPGVSRLLAGVRRRRQTPILAQEHEPPESDVPTPSRRSSQL